VIRTSLGGENYTTMWKRIQVAASYTVSGIELSVPEKIVIISLCNIQKKASQGYKSRTTTDKQNQNMDTGTQGWIKRDWLT
jgi:hypothetical protein